MGEAKRRKRLLGDKYGDPEYSNKKYKKFTKDKLTSDMMKNPQCGQWTPIIWMFVIENWNHGFLSGLNKISVKEKKVEVILKEIDKWWERFNSEDFERSLKEDELISIGDIVKRVSIALACIAEMFNAERCTVINFKECNVNSEKDVKTMLFVFSLAIYCIHHPEEQDQVA